MKKLSLEMSFKILLHIFQEMSMEVHVLRLHSSISLKAATVLCKAHTSECAPRINQKHDSVIHQNLYVQVA